MSYFLWLPSGLLLSFGFIIQIAISRNTGAKPDWIPLLIVVVPFVLLPPVSLQLVIFLRRKRWSCVPFGTVWRELLIAGVGGVIAATIISVVLSILFVPGGLSLADTLSQAGSFEYRMWQKDAVLWCFVYGLLVGMMSFGLWFGEYRSIRRQTLQHDNANPIAAINSEA